MCNITNKPNTVHVVFIDEYSDYYITQTQVHGIYQSRSHASYVVNELNNRFALDDYCEQHAYYTPMDVIKGDF